MLKKLQKFFTYSLFTLINSILPWIAIWTIKQLKSELLAFWHNFLSSAFWVLIIYIVYFLSLVYQTIKSPTK